MYSYTEHQPSVERIDCLVCNGHGEVFDPSDDEDVHTGWHTCTSCGGRGFRVAVPSRTVMPKGAM